VQRKQEKGPYQPTPKRKNEGKKTCGIREKSKRRGNTLSSRMKGGNGKRNSYGLKREEDREGKKKGYCWKESELDLFVRLGPISKKSSRAVKHIILEGGKKK